MIKLVKMKAMKILYQMNQCQRLKKMATPIEKSIVLPTMQSITLKKVRRYMIIEALILSMQEAGLQEAFAENIGSNLQ